MIKGNFKIGNLDFVDWFNQARQTRPDLFPNNFNKQNFEKFMSNIKDWTGKEEVTLEEFIGHLCIIYNETGGLWAFREMGGAAYMFNTVMPNGHTKHSYNKAPNRLAGNQLAGWGFITDQEISTWNGQVYPINASQTLHAQALNCDFFKYRGFGLCQITWRDSFIRSVEPLLKKGNLDLYTTAELDVELMSDFSYLTKSYHLFWSTTQQGVNAVNAMQSGDYRWYGNFISGNWAWYVNNKYIPRCQWLLNMIKQNNMTEKKYSIDGMNLLPSQIKKIQLELLDLANGEVKEKMLGNGGADGYWGDTTEWAFEIVGKSIDDLLNFDW